MRRRVIAQFFAALCLDLSAADAAGQSGGFASDRAPERTVRPPLGESVSAPARPVERLTSDPGELRGTFQPAPGPRRSRDSLLNGTLIGAVVGAAALGTVAAFICFQQESGEICRSDTLRATAIGAAIGAGAGLAVDASMTRRPAVAVRIGLMF